MKVYFDNAATTPIDSRVVESMLPCLQTHFGNPSSTHSFGRKAKGQLELARNCIAEVIGTSPAHIFFMSSATEANNFILANTAKKKNIQHAVSTALEHHAVLTTLEVLEKEGHITLHLLPFDSKGAIRLSDLEKLLQKHGSSVMVSLMHGNNEIGNLNPIDAIGRLCIKYGAIYHCDSVQTMGHYPIDVHQLNIDALVGTSHKFYGPKGVGFCYLKSVENYQAMIYGGSQEKSMRGGTENIASIVGMAKALQLVSQEREHNKKHVLALKNYFIEQLKTLSPEICFNGLSADCNQSLYSVLNVNIPRKDSMLLFKLDLKGIAASYGSACSSGATVASHVLDQLNVDTKKYQPIRFSFGKQNTLEEVDYVVEELRGYLEGK